MPKLRLGMAQINTTVGDFVGNTGKILENMALARIHGVDVLTFPEMAVSGYPPEDLLFRRRFVEENRKCLDEIIGQTEGTTVIIGFIDATPAGNHNAAAVAVDGRLMGVYHKVILPNYGVFDENRYFQSGNECPVYTIGGVKLGISICEDIWFEDGPAVAGVLAGAEIMLNISASPYYVGKYAEREQMLKNRAVENLAVCAYNNLVGGQDELVFDGGSTIIDETGRVVARGRQFAEDLVIADIDTSPLDSARQQSAAWQARHQKSPVRGLEVVRVVVSEAPFADNKPTVPNDPVVLYEPTAEVYHALATGTGDYIRKNGFTKVLVGMSGGIDSALVAAIAADAIGPENVLGVTMPSRYSSDHSVKDSVALAENLGLKLMHIPIEPSFEAYLEMLEPVFKGTEPNVAEENLQARIRGTLLMAISNKFGYLLLTTGNKSEMATGYATLYGDMAGGFAVIKDVPKTLVYRLAEYRNELAGREYLPMAIIEKAPSAELRPDQFDSDSLPPYDWLDGVLQKYIEEDCSVEEIAALGFDQATVERTARLVDISEYKRRQAPPGVKISVRAFGRDRRLPITNRFLAR
ncbi:NAD+ synthase [Chloroflexota bacterium]